MTGPALTKPASLVIAEDDEFVQRLLAAYLGQEGFDVRLAGTGRELLAELDSDPCDLVLLDLGLPDEDGLVLMRQIRARSTIPIIVLTARQDREDRISALEMGADDYLSKPADPEELVLRVKNLLERSRAMDQSAPQGGNRSVLEFEGWSLDLAARTLTASTGEDVHLSRAEFNLLAALVHAPHRVLSRGQLLDAISYHDQSPSERTIDVIIARLRKKFEADPKTPRLITTMVGMGYKFSASVTRRS